MEARQPRIRPGVVEQLSLTPDGGYIEDAVSGFLFRKDQTFHRLQAEMATNNGPFRVAAFLNGGFFDGDDLAVRNLAGRATHDSDPTQPPTRVEQALAAALAQEAASGARQPVPTTCATTGNCASVEDPEAAKRRALLAEARDPRGAFLDGKPPRGTKLVAGKPGVNGHYASGKKLRQLTRAGG